MGLLDDAIHEHLELKRLRGADPGTVAREERDVFGPVSGDGQASTDDNVPAQDDLAVGDTLPMEDDLPQMSHPDQAQGFSNVGQETAELDMRTVLDDAAGRDTSSAGPIAHGSVEGRRPAEASSPERDAVDDSLEWEMPADNASVGVGGHVESDRHPGTQDLSGGGSAGQADEPVEDVLEETPDFLRDTPEQERLWFEQRPPRDFDFDK